MSPLRAGVIGLGMGRHHITGYQSHPDAQVVAIADLDKERLEEFGTKHDITKRYTSAEAMLQEENLDVVSVATPNHLHMPLTLAALGAGCHVLCEKPMALNVQEGQMMLDAARSAGKRLMISFNFRFSEASVAAKRHVDTGVLGEIYHSRTFWLRRRGLPRFGGWFSQKAFSGGGPLIDLGVHRLDLALWLMGYPNPKWVMGSTYSHIGSAMAKEHGVSFDVEDMAAALIKFENGATLELAASWASHIQQKEWMETRLFGARGGLVQRNIDEGYRFETEVYVDSNGSQFDMKLHPSRQPLENPMYHFVDSIVNDSQHMAPGEEGLVVMKILDAIYQSARIDGPVRVNGAS